MVLFIFGCNPEQKEDLLVTNNDISFRTDQPIEGSEECNCKIQIVDFDIDLPANSDGYLWDLMVSGVCANSNCLPFWYYFLEYDCGWSDPCIGLSPVPLPTSLLDFNCNIPASTPFEVNFSTWSETDPCEPTGTAEVVPGSISFRVICNDVLGQDGGSLECPGYTHTSDIITMEYDPTGNPFPFPVYQTIGLGECGCAPFAL